MANQKALFLDRDGTLIKDAHYLKDPEHLEIIESVGPALIKAKEVGYLLFLHTNQSGIARGYYEWEDVYACNQRMHEEFRWPADFFAEVCIAPESPEEKIVYRKPAPRFEIEMTEKYSLDPSSCWVIGDKWIDPKTGLDAGMRGALVRTGKPVDQALEQKAAQNKVSIFTDLAEFVTKELIG
jgi:D-glycero-D-manno-heptose 1,7-bisphosphate phosphatase